MYFFIFTFLPSLVTKHLDDPEYKTSQKREIKAKLVPSSIVPRAKSANTAGSTLGHRVQKEPLHLFHSSLDCLNGDSCSQVLLNSGEKGVEAEKKVPWLKSIRKRYPGVEK